MSEFALNELQAQWLLSQGLVPEAALQQALLHCRGPAPSELCQCLEQRSLIDQGQAYQTRQAVQFYQQNHRWPPSQDSLKTHSTPRDAPISDSGRLNPLTHSAGPNIMQVVQAALQDRYVIEGVAGQGGMGMILKAFRLKDQVPVAIKVLTQENAERVETKRFQREARLVQALNHPNIARVFEHGMATQVPYFVMEWIEGLDLEEKIRAYYKGEQASFSHAELTLFLADVADALAYCHREGLIHRDVKPSNILICNGRAKLIDFGLVKRDEQVMDSHSLTLSKSGEALGTPAFMAPEQVDPKGDFGTVCPATDVWGLGTTLFYALTGMPPYEGETITNLYIKLLTQAPPKLSDINPELPAELSLLCEQCMQKQSQERISIDELRQRLRAFARPKQKRRPIILALALVLLAALAAAFLWPGAPVLEEPSAQAKREITQAESVLIEGQCNLAKVIVRSGDVSAVSNADGHYELEVALKEGKNKVSVTFQFQDQSFEKKLIVVRDSQAPKIDLGLLDNKVVLDDERRIQGTVIDQSAVDLWVNKEPVELGENGAFQFQFPKEGLPPEKIQLIAQDRAGNRVVKDFEAVTSDRYYYEQSKRALSDIQRWDVLPDALQDKIIRSLSRALKGRFRLVGVKRYQVAGQSHRIASFRHRKSGLIFQLIPGGTFRMGLDYNKRVETAVFLRSEGQGGAVSQLTVERPDHDCVIRKPFFLSQTEVSQKVWNILAVQSEKAPAESDLPMTRVSWRKCVRWLASGDLRLPSEAEWEYACRGSSRSRFFWGDQKNESFANVNSSVIAPVTRRVKQTNAFGLADITGNVWEWCQDGWIDNYKAGPLTEAPRGDAKKMGAVFRGGSAVNPWTSARSTYRGRAPYSSRAQNIGFRAAADVFPD